jgi:hypothetical protein
VFPEPGWAASSTWLGFGLPIPTQCHYCPWTCWAQPPGSKDLDSVESSIDRQNAVITTMLRAGGRAGPQKNYVRHATHHGSTAPDRERSTVYPNLHAALHVPAGSRSPPILSPHNNHCRGGRSRARLSRSLHIRQLFLAASCRLSYHQVAVN